MKINIEDYLHQLDSYFKEKSQKDTYVTYAMVVSVIIAFSYLLFWDSSFNEFEKTRKQVISLSKSINSYESYLQKNPEAKITRLVQEIKNINKQVKKKKDTNAYIKSKIETISSLIYDERAWGEYLHSISINAKKNNVKILDLTNKYATNKDSFGHILNITVKSTGSYKNTLKFINSLEQSDLVVDVHDLTLEAKDTLSSSLDISVWGITY
ncbi:MAG: type 4a pilus biogenesis protein PilO [Sulfurimonas sp.]